MQVVVLNFMHSTLQGKEALAAAGGLEVEARQLHGELA